MTKEKAIMKILQEKQQEKMIKILQNVTQQWRFQIYVDEIQMSFKGK